MSIPRPVPSATIAPSRGCSSVGSSVSHSRLELRPISTILEAYLADLAARAGVPRPGILSPDSRRWAADGSPAEMSNTRSGKESPAPLPKPGA